MPSDHDLTRILSVALTAGLLCNVAVKFGIEVSLWVLPAETTGHWRPGLAKR